MSITFEMHEQELWICYAPQYGSSYIRDKLLNKESFTIKHAFRITPELLREEPADEIEEYKFCIGQLVGEYIHLYSDVFRTIHDFFFFKDIPLKYNFFIASRNISILPKIDELIDRDFYIGGNWEAHHGISADAYKKLIKSFPTSSELDKYTHHRISNILKEYYPECDKYEQVYDDYMRKLKKTYDHENTPSPLDFNQQIELEQFKLAAQELSDMLRNLGIDEATWQTKIHKILKLLYPQYIYCAREVQFPGPDKEAKRPDFLLVDVHGFIDILEIKKAAVQVLSQYRNNYVPSREFTGAIQQIEKYTLSLNTIDKAKEKVKSALAEVIPANFTLNILNPQGILLLGRSNEFTSQQRSDFELIKRQYKHIADIMTYDDLLMRLNNIIVSLSPKTAE